MKANTKESKGIWERQENVSTKMENGTRARKIKDTTTVEKYVYVNFMKLEDSRGWGHLWDVENIRISSLCSPGLFFFRSALSYPSLCYQASTPLPRLLCAFLGSYFCGARWVLTGGGLLFLVWYDMIEISDGEKGCEWGTTARKCEETMRRSCLLTKTLDPVAI